MWKPERHYAERLDPRSIGPPSIKELRTSRPQGGHIRLTVRGCVDGWQLLESTSCSWVLLGAARSGHDETTLRFPTLAWLFADARYLSEAHDDRDRRDGRVSYSNSCFRAMRVRQTVKAPQNVPRLSYPFISRPARALGSMAAGRPPHDSIRVSSAIPRKLPLGNVAQEGNLTQ